MMIVERPIIENLNPPDYLHTSTRVIDGRKYAVTVDLRNFTLPDLEPERTTPFGTTYQVLNHRVDWESVRRAIGS